MTKLFWNVFRLSPLVIAATFFAANNAFAAEAKEGITSVAQLSQAQESNNIGQVTSVSQFSDVQPTDWAFQALQSLVERYGCIAGYPNGTYRGNRAMTRYEFAAGVNACLDRVNELIATATADLVKREDLTTLQRLQEEFAAELATLRGRVDALDARTSELEAKQFSTTTKLVGEAIFSVSDTFGDRAALGSRALVNDRTGTLVNPKLDSNPTLSDRVRLSFNSSFTGTDQLQIRMQAGNVLSNNSNTNAGLPGTNPGTGTVMSRLAFDNNTSNAVQLDKIRYAFNLSDKARVTVDANNGEFWENINNFNPDLSSSGRGSISRYGRFSPIYRQGQGGAGATITFNPAGRLSASAGYLAGGRNNVANDPAFGRGLVDGNYAALGQVAFKVNDAFNIGGTYVRTYQNSAGGVNMFESTGSDLVNSPFGTNVPTSANHFGIQANYKLNPTVTLGGWVGYTNAQAQTNGNTQPTAVGGSSTLTGTALTNAVNNRNVVNKGDNADFFYWATNLTFKDFGREGNLLAFTFGQPPKVTSSDFRPNLTTGSFGRIEQKDSDTSYHLEALYRMQINNNITVAPALLVIFNPEHNERNDTIYVGTLRTTFTF